jgi:hypothetical protein
MAAQYELIRPYHASREWPLLPRLTNTLKAVFLCRFAFDCTYNLAASTELVPAKGLVALAPT